MFFFSQATSEIPLMQETVTRLFLIGLSKYHPLNGPDTVDLAEFLAKRAAALHHLAAEDQVSCINLSLQSQNFEMFTKFTFCLRISVCCTLTSQRNLLSS